MTAPPRQPIIIGVGELVHRAADPHDVLEPLDMMARVARAAALDAEIPRHLDAVDSLTVINIISRPYADPPGFLAARLGIHPSERLYTSMGGNSPQWRINETADRIARGEVRLALIAGAEAMHGLQLARRAGVALDWADTGTPPMVGDSRWGNNDVEQRHHAQMPTNVYPLFENALRARRGWSIARHRAYLGELCAGMAAVARDNPIAWFRDGKSAAEITAVGPQNRMVAFPYPKFMNAIIAVDQAAALLMTSVETARALGVPESKWVYVRGCGDATDHWLVSDRVNFWSSPAIRVAGERALAQARLEIGAIAELDLYSCFPCAVQIAADMLGIAVDDPRPRTVAGGLPYHGGPGNNYSTHAVARMVQRLRSAPGQSGLVSAVGWYLTKHAVGVYSSAPPDHPFAREDPGHYQPRIDAEPHPELASAGDGDATIETYTVQHDRDGAPSVGIFVLRLGDGRRCWANSTDPTLLARLEMDDLIGQSGRVQFDDATSTNTFAV
jgi:acetyl-CoA C-acetyltransferase